MQRNRRCIIYARGAAFLIFVLIVSLGTAFAGKEPKIYSEEGKVIGAGTTDVHGFGPHGDENTVQMPSYKIETDNKIYQVRCAKSFACAGKNKLKLGEIIRFRVGKKLGVQCLFFQAPGDDKERYVMVLSEELKPETKPADKPQASQP